MFACPRASSLNKHTMKDFLLKKFTQDRVHTLWEPCLDAPDSMQIHQRLGYDLPAGVNSISDRLASVPGYGSHAGQMHSGDPRRGLNGARGFSAANQRAVDGDECGGTAQIRPQEGAQACSAGLSSGLSKAGGGTRTTLPGLAGWALAGTPSTAPSA